MHFICIRINQTNRQMINLAKTKQASMTILLVLFILNTGLSTKGFSQSKGNDIKNGLELTGKMDSIAHFTAFTGKAISGNIYLRWTVERLKQDGVFLVYSSSNGVDYAPIATKDAVGIPFNESIAYYLNIKDFGEGTKYFKIIYISNNSQYLASNRLTITSDSKAMVLQESNSVQ